MDYSLKFNLFMVEMLDSHVNMMIRSLDRSKKIIYIQSGKIME